MVQNITLISTIYLLNVYKNDSEEKDAFTLIKE